MLTEGEVKCWRIKPKAKTLTLLMQYSLLQSLSIGAEEDQNLLIGTLWVTIIVSRTSITRRPSLETPITSQIAKDLREFDRRV